MLLGFLCRGKTKNKTHQITPSSDQPAESPPSNGKKLWHHAAILSLRRVEVCISKRICKKVPFTH